MTLEHLARCVICSDSATIKGVPSTLAELTLMLPEDWSTGIMGGLTWAVCSDTCHKLLTYERIQRYNERRSKR
jgi:hypothetical protein